MFIRLLFLASLFLLNTSCSGSTVSRIEYQQYKLDLSTIIELPLKHNGWRQISSLDDICEKTIFMVESNYVVDTLVLPPKVELHFCGGSLKGNIIFNDTYLSGSVNLHGSQISGSIKNNEFQAGWICHGDGVHDDAQSINQILAVCNNVRFNRGTYLLSSYHNPRNDLSSSHHKSVKSHIGIFRDNITLRGDEGASLLVKEPSAAICVYSLPDDIENSVKNVRIKGLAFRNENDGKEFFEFFHTIKLIGSSDISISNCNFFDFWGDAISLSHYGDTPDTGERTRNRRVVVRGNYIDGGNHNNRNGISIASGENILVECNLFVETSRYNMPGSIDIEANNSAYTVKDIQIINNQIQGCHGGLGSIGVVSNDKEAPAKNIIIKGNSISDSDRGICLLIDSKKSTKLFKVIDNKFVKCKNPLILRGSGSSEDWIIKKNNKNKKIQFSGNLEIKNFKTDAKLIKDNH